ncbi:MAG: hypothetical protein EAZ92_03080 [Candidatus Kapaibacterium sp.]|nr:MAG: hypothetical protein EAZ92_03080 [Candidatus Kapabacteria bacterium]
MEVPEFNFDGAVQNPFAAQYKKGVTRTIIKSDGTKEHFIRLDPDVAKHYRSATSVNKVLRRAVQNRQH